VHPQQAVNTSNPKGDAVLSRQQVERWVGAYVHAWETYDTDDIATLFTADGEYHEWPYQTHWIGRDAIVEGWREREAWQEGGWTFEWSLLTINGDTAAVDGTGVYRSLGTFANLWVVTFGDAGTCSTFRMWNNEV
jgi:hypothetical protein